MFMLSGRLRRKWAIDIAKKIYENNGIRNKLD